MLTTVKRKSFIINITGFGLVGLSYYLLSISGVISGPIYHPLADGWIGIGISIYGALSVYEYLKKGYISFVQNGIYTTILSIIYFFMFFFIGTVFSGPLQDYLVLGWAGLLIMLYFIFLGGLNAYLGFYIAIFNVAITLLVLTGYSQGETDPLVWVNILDLMGIQNTYIQWGIVFVSAILGLTENGISFIDKQNL